MNQFILKYCLLSLIVLSFGCHKSEKEEVILKGDVSIVITKQSSLINVAAARTVDVSNYHVQIINSKNAVVKEYNNLSEVPASVTLNEGIYTIAVSSTKNQQEAIFDIPYYEGKEVVKVKANKHTDALITCKLIQTKVSVGFTEHVKSAFKKLNVTVSNKKGDLIFEKEEKRAGYFKLATDSTLTLLLSVENLKGNVYTRSLKLEHVKPSEYYHVVFDLEGSGGSSSLQIEVDERTTDKKWNFEMPVTAENIPVISSANFDFDNPPTFRVGDGTDAIIKVVTKSPLKSLIVHVKSNFLKLQGVPASFDIENMTPSVANVLTSLGVVITTVQDEKVIDFSELSKKLPVENNGLTKHELKVIATNSEDIGYEKEIVFNVIPLADVAATIAVDPWAKFAILSGSYAGGDASNLTFQYREKNGSWITINDNMNVVGNVYNYKLEGLNPATSYEFRAYRADDVTGVILPFTTESIIGIDFLDFKTWTSNGKYSLPGNNLSSTQWGSGDKGAAELAIPAYLNTIQPKPSLNAAEYARLESKSAPFGFKAAGSLFLGTVHGSGYKDVAINFGIPFTSRPTKFKFKYRYNPNQYDGKTDEFDAYVLLQVRQGGTRYRLGTAWLRSNTKETDWVEIELPIIYGDDPNFSGYMQPKSNFAENREQGFYAQTTAKPTDLIMVFSSSAHGADKKSAAVGTTFDVKDVEILY
ncbi:DUF4493 domain-containing protein [Flammeovirga kamogawensis]|uniref:DUF4493 domain-containing protein n=1 Tax=Flammeovirga kamogawensis TaxID=373891 RepID=A0ABX8H579_9BACT|nr:DUF4493 domain-containing protein [Flammeovirga kamogawensis]MBB6461826.1 hypothetical protein [Flammeovirga kamogawensis]QWG10742.1 DUF4493 domain-containing protein [Flammeovirga kamogawensis]